jgi:hypothetical protein
VILCLNIFALFNVIGIYLFVFHWIVLIWLYLISEGAIMFMIVWLLDLQLPVLITSEIVNLNPVHLLQVTDKLGVPGENHRPVVSHWQTGSTRRKKTNCHNIIEIMLKVALNMINKQNKNKLHWFDCNLFVLYVLIL